MKTSTKVITRADIDIQLALAILVLLGVSAVSFLITTQTTPLTCQGKLGDLNNNYWLDTGDEEAITNIYGGLAPYAPCADMNGNGMIDPEDIYIHKRLRLSQPTTCPGKLGDLNNNNRLDTDDEQIIKNIYSGLIPYTPCADMNSNGIMDPNDISIHKNLQLNEPPSQDWTTKAVNLAYTADSKYELKDTLGIYSLSIDANIRLPYTYSLIRVILADIQGKEYLVYEGYPLISQTGNFTISNSCDETCALDNIIPSYLIIQAEDARIMLKNIYVTRKQTELSGAIRAAGIANYAAQSKKQKDLEKIAKINGFNNTIQSADASAAAWVAGETTVSKLSYAEKKALFGDKEFLPDLQGFEYYKEGVFRIAGVETPEDIADKNVSTSTSLSNANILPDSLDWRTRHGGVMTPVKYQSNCGSCYIFATIGMVEAQINHYYNQKINADLSEQDLMCKFDKKLDKKGKACNGGLPVDLLPILNNQGVVQENCFPYQGKNYNCADQLCWSERWLTQIYPLKDVRDETIKKYLVEKGPLTLGINDWDHVIVLVGYRNLYDSNGNLENVVWIIKNSWGIWWGIDGYAEMSVNLSQRSDIFYTINPVFIDNRNAYQIVCTDNDGDGYCYWGSSDTKPPSCYNLRCKTEKDFNDCNHYVNAEPGSSDCSTKTYVCNPKPAVGTVWNTVSYYKQTLTRSGNVSYPLDDPITEYNEISSTNSCRFKCERGYKWNGRNCIQTRSPLPFETPH